MWRGFVVAVILVAAGSVAFADDPAAAQALYEEAKGFQNAGDYVQACPRFETSYRFDPAIGTLLNLADCHEHLNRIATAWAEYIKVEEASSSQTTDKAKSRARFAHDHVTALAPRLARLAVVLPRVAIDGIAVTRDGVNITAVVGSTLPVDPGITSMW